MSRRVPTNVAASVHRRVLVHAQGGDALRGVGGGPASRDNEVTLPTLLDFPAPRLRAYPVEAVVAEKLHAIA